MSDVMFNALKEAGILNNRFQRNHNWLLKKYKNVPIINNPSLDGKDHINVAGTGRTELGKKISPCWKQPFTHAFGSFLSMNIFMHFVNTKNFPMSVVRSSRSGCVDSIIRKMKLEKINIPNYWAIVTEAMWEKIKQHGLANMLRDSELPFTSYTLRKSVKQSEFSTTSFNMVYYRDNMVNYIGVLEEIRLALQEGRDVADVIEGIKFYPNKDLYDGVPFIVEDTTDTGTDTGEKEEDDSESVNMNDGGEDMHDDEMPDSDMPDSDMHDDMMEED